MHRLFLAGCIERKGGDGDIEGLARLAGAGTLAQLRDVVLPFIRGHVLTNTLLISLWTFNDFGPYLLTAGGPGYQTEVLPIFTYRTAFRSFDLGYGAALSSLLLAVNVVLASLYLRLIPKAKR